MKRASLIYVKGKNKENNFEDNNKNISTNEKHLYYKKLKENAKIFCQKVRNLDSDCESYEKIDESNCKINLRKRNLFNMGNLERLIKLKCIKDGGYSYEDYEESIEYLRKCINEHNLFCGKATSGYFPNFIKKEKFLCRTMIRYANFQGKYFGVPV